MTTVAPKQKSSQANQWWYAEQLIAGLDASAQVKLLLFLVHLHTNKKTGRAWTSQETLAVEMNLDVSRVTEHFATAKRLGFIGVDRVRTGKRPADQHNEYWVITERLLDCQCPERNTRNRNEHTALAPGDTNEHTAPPRCDAEPNTPRQQGKTQGASENEHTAKSSGTHRASAREGSKELQVVSKAVAAVAVEVAATAAYEKAVSSPVGSPAAAASPKSQTKTFSSAASPENQTEEEYIARYRDLQNRMWAAYKKNQDELAEQLKQQMRQLDRACRCIHGYHRWSCGLCLCDTPTRVHEKRALLSPARDSDREPDRRERKHKHKSFRWPSK